jgi:hypothetical protein
MGLFTSSSQFWFKKKKIKLKQILKTLSLPNVLESFEYLMCYVQTGPEKGLRPCQLRVPCWDLVHHIHSEIISLLNFKIV